MTSPTNWRELHHRMKSLATVARLPIRSGQWSGVSGSVLGLNSGSSIDFQDQRPYLPGDDPRHINWQAYARSGSYTMKLYRQEVTPRLDLLFDATASMFLTPAKADRTWELVYFTLESALRLGASIRLHLVTGKWEEWPVERAMAYGWPEQIGTPPQDSATTKPASFADLISRVPLRAGSLRVLISDLLTDQAPEAVTNALMRGRGRTILFAPFCQEEAQPDWQGNIEFEACETGGMDRRRVEKDVMTRYLKAYETHFSLWREQCARHGMALGRIPSEGNLLNAFRLQALSAGCVEM